MKFLVLLVLVIVVAVLVRKVLAGPPSSDDEVRDNPRIPTGEQADTPSRHPDDEPHV